MGAPLTPTWTRPSHPNIQEVIISDSGFTSKSLSRISVPPFGLYAKMAFPPCTKADSPTYATVQFGRDEHLNLNSDLLYINHSCEPSLIFDTANLEVIAGPKGLKPGEELTASEPTYLGPEHRSNLLSQFFYPSTEWSMDQPFDCLCGTPTCRGRISGAKDMTDAQLAGLWINGHIRKLKEEQKAKFASSKATLTNGHANGTHHGVDGLSETGSTNGSQRRGPTSRELSGEMGGDTTSA
ncbi:hypothetical protein GE09DRAFT_1017034 [Coniochaeta sp. 2T2.1]|nr:hypothetical protein GE09DRAFT_1017034 [Coniochaeta sp. 2T2.1]